MIVYSCFSHKGGRGQNEDYIGCTTDSSRARGAFVLADGLGGHSGGEIASGAAVNAFLKAFEKQQELTNQVLSYLVDTANQAVLANQTVGIDKKGMGAVLAAALYDNGHFRYLNIGDARLYYIRGEQMYRVTKDHSVSQLSVDMGRLDRRDIPKDPDRGKVLKVLGDPSLQPGEFDEEIIPQEEDGFLLCSDGAWEYLDDEEIIVDFCKSGDPLQWKTYMLNRILPRQRENCDNFSLICGSFIGQGFREV